MKRAGGAIAVWGVTAAGVAALTTHVRDWFVMTDELLYERLALSVLRLHTPLPRVHGVSIPNVNQLYPLLLAPVIGDGSVAHGLQLAHVLNAVIMTSAAVPAFLLARRAAGDAWATVAALLSAVVPWLVLSSFLLTEVVAYPVFLWTLLACTAAVERATSTRDLLAVVAIVVAVGARTQFVVFAPVLALAIVARRDVRRHRVLVGLFALALAVALLAELAGHSPLGTYGSTTSGNPLPASTIGAAFTHLASVAIGIALVPFLVGGAWLLAEARRDSFALTGSLTVLLLAIEVGAYDERFGGGISRDRYVSYLAPVLLIAFVIAAARRELRPWPFAVSLGVLALGLALSPLPVYDKLNVDAPVAIIDNYLRAELGGLAGARMFLVAAAVVGAAFVGCVWLLLPRRWQAAALVAPVLALTTAETGYAFVRLFRVDGTAGRPLTLDPSPVMSWVDPLVHGASVTMLPFPTVSGDYWSSAAYWWDLEFWNRRVDRSAGVPGEFEWTPSTFPKLALRFDDLGRASVSPSPYVVQAVADTRFHLLGRVVTNNRNAFLVDTDRPWRADWATDGLYDDGWTIPRRPAQILVYPYRGQDGRVTRTLSVSAFAPPGVTERRFTLAAGRARSGAVAGSNEVTQSIEVCVGASRPAVVVLTVDGVSKIPGDPKTVETVARLRLGGVQVSRIYESGEVTPGC